MNEDTDPARRLLVDMLHEAAQLEHCLLDAYLYAACALKSTPQELAMIAGHPNRRRAIQFERLRGWKQSILAVAHEEMLHLHYVQCMLRALGERPRFALPGRNARGVWTIPNWRAQLGARPADGGKGVEIPIAPPSLATFQRFVLLESTDSLQFMDPFGAEATALYEQLYAFELDLRFESMLVDVADDARRTALKAKLRALYCELSPVEAVTAEMVTVLRAEVALPPLDELRFQSIADFYTRGILPLYEQAFDRGWVAHAGRALNDELADPRYAAEGLLPIGPVQRSKNFTELAGKGEDPTRNFAHVRDVVREIVEEGEGATGFVERARAMLAKVAEIGGRGFVLALQQDQARAGDPTYQTPAWLAEAQRIRLAHLYRFAMIVTELGAEQALAAHARVEFVPWRQPVDLAADPQLVAAAAELPAQLNAAYLTMLAWLSRIYEIEDWMADKPRRQSIEMLASWPLMSLAIRPMLELAGCLPVDAGRLFRLEVDALPELPVHAQQLRALYAGDDRSEATAEAMDYFALRTLSDIAAWARRQVPGFAASSLPAPERQLIVTRLLALATLDEFEKQFPFRESGGYSARMPDQGYIDRHPDSDRYEESPTAVSPIFQDTLALRLRFSGWGRVQLATDPDPPTDEVGCTGTHMVHAADGDRWFDRALVWQETDAERDFTRGPVPALPRIGVACAEVSLVVADQVTAGFVPLQVLQSVGAAQANGVQQAMSVQGFSSLLDLPPSEIVGPGRDIRVDLRPSGGVRPFLNGQNHLVFQDGEPIDPFVLAVSADSEHGPQLAFQREVYNQGTSMLQMMPLERIGSGRVPCGFDFDFGNIPAWAKRGLGPMQRALIDGTVSPRGYLHARGVVLLEALDAAITAGTSREQVDTTVSFAERLLGVAQPRGTTRAWLGILLHYGHTISGAAARPAGTEPICSAIRARAGVGVRVIDAGERNAANTRWLIGYTNGIMDTDALANFVYGELYVPIAVQPTSDPIAISSSWTFSGELIHAVAGFACTFARPFWAAYDVSSDTRTRKLDDGTVVTETRASAQPQRYTVTVTGIPSVDRHLDVFEVAASAPEACRLTWSTSFIASSAEAVVAQLQYVARTREQMRAALTAHFAPH
jgi:hypothetical protein